LTAASASNHHGCLLRCKRCLPNIGTHFGATAAGAGIVGAITTVTTTVISASRPVASYASAADIKDQRGRNRIEGSRNLTTLATHRATTLAAVKIKTQIRN
jgi:hypothetical protein